jgi:predicted transcriptional regulator
MRKKYWNFNSCHEARRSVQSQTPIAPRSPSVPVFSLFECVFASFHLINPDICPSGMVSTTEHSARRSAECEPEYVLRYVAHQRRSVKMSEHVTVRLPAELRQSLKARAEAVHKSQSAVMVEAFVEYLGRHDEAAFQRAADRECELLNAADTQDPDLDAFMDAAAEDLAGDDNGTREH